MRYLAILLIASSLQAKHFHLKKKYLTVAIAAAGTALVVGLHQHDKGHLEPRAPQQQRVGY